jgi:predicted RNA-binding protein
MKFWLNTISKDHVLRGVEGGFTQANHGSPRNIKRMSKGDYIVFYSPKTKYQDGEPLQMFTAIGQITDDEPYQVVMSENFMPFRRKVKFYPCTELPIRPVIDDLEFITNKKNWGYKFHMGFFQINEHDFKLIAEQMGASI